MSSENDYNEINTEDTLLDKVRRIKFNDSDIILNLKRFFNIILTSWESLNIDLVLSNISIDNSKDTALFFNELFNCLYELAMESETNINANNIIAMINSLDTLLPEILISELSGSNHALNEYENIKEKSFTACFNQLKQGLDLYGQSQDNNLFFEINNVFLILTRVSRIKYSEIYVYKFASFLWDLFHVYYENHKILGVLLFCLSSISDQLVKFLIWKTDAENNELFKLLALDIFETLKNDLIQVKFISSEIPYVLNILDQHDRFIGQFVDAVPENTLKDGYVLCSSLSLPLENDDVYEAFEQFTAS